MAIKLFKARQSETGGLAPMPTEIRWALVLLWSSLVFSFLWQSYALYLFYVWSASKSGNLASSAMIQSFVLSYLVFFCHAYLNICIARRKNWARIVELLLIVGVLVYPIVIKLFLLPPNVNIPPMELSPFQYFLNGVVPALNFVALYLLFLSPGRFWFRRIPPQAGS